MPNLPSICLRFLFFIYGFLLIFLTPACKPDLDQVEQEDSLLVTIKIEGQGNVTPTSGTYKFNQSLDFSATAAPGYYFDRWIGFGETVESAQYEWVVTHDLMLTARFLPLPELTDEVIQYDPKKIDPHPVFMIENGGTTAYLTAKTGERLQTWNFDSKLGNDLEMLSDGSLLGLFKPDEVSFSFGGYGGILKKFDPEGVLVWDYEVNSETELLHHDFEVLPNGNMLLLVWEAFTEIEAKAIGFKGVGPIYLEKLVEWNPDTQEVVWQWRSVEHLIQEENPTASNFGIVAEYPEKINLNYHENENGDLMHANGLYYDPERDVIFVSVNFYSEVWVVPHQYDTETSTGPQGDLVFRFGNPEAYQGSGLRLFYNNHHPTLVEHDPETSGNFLIYMNGSKEEQSVVYEFELPQQFESDPADWRTPEVVWSFTNPDLFFGRISGSFRLPNGNTLICEGDFGFWEVTPEGEVVWKYRVEKNVWRGYVYPNK